MRWLLPLVLIATAAVAGALENANVASPEQAPVLREITPFKAAITIRNPNDRAVRVAKIDSSCSCSKLNLHDHFLLPNATTILDVEVDNANRSGPQSLNISLYLSDPDLESIEAVVLWQVRPCVQVDNLRPGVDPLQRPPERAHQDIYRYVDKERPDELNRLSKRVRLSCPPAEQPAGGLQVTAIDYAGTLWKFTPTVQSDGSVLITAGPADPTATVAEQVYNETVVIHTNHPDKASIELKFTTLIAKNAASVVFDPNAKPDPKP